MHIKYKNKEKLPETSVQQSKRQILEDLTKERDTHGKFSLSMALIYGFIIVWMCKGQCKVTSAAKHWEGYSTKSSRNVSHNFLY